MKRCMLLLIACMQSTIFLSDSSEFIMNKNQALQILQDYKESFISLPFQPLIHGLLEQKYNYEFMYSGCDGNSSYVLIKSFAPYTYLVGNPNQQQLKDIVKNLSDYCDNQKQIFDPMHDEKIALICDASLHGLFMSQGFVIKPRIEFDFINRKEIILQQLPHGYTVQKIDTIDLFKQSTWFDFVTSSCSGVDNFFNHSFGYAVVNDEGQSIAESYGAWIGDEQCEIGIVTHPDYRGQGYIMYALQKTLDECQARNIKPVWSCNCDNVASYKIALKLGFQIKNYYVFLKKF